MISRKTKYGLKALSFLAKRGNDSPIQISLISESENIPRKFLENILLQLRHSGYLGSKKGKRGGYYLLKKPEAITITEVYRILEGPIAMLPCVSLNFYERCHDCKDEENCHVHALMLQIRDNTLSIYNHTTLADLV